MEIILKEYSSLLSGALVTISILLGLLSIGFISGLVLAVLEVYGNRLLKTAAFSIERVLRGIPALVLLMLAYFSLGSYIDSPILLATITLGIRSMAYQSQIFRGAIQALDPGQLLAAQSINMNKLQSILYIILPQALRFAIGPWSNEFTAEAKMTSLAYVVGALDILRRGRYIIQYTHGNTMLIYFVVALFYLFIARAGNSVLYYFEKKLSIPGFKRRA